MQMDVTGGWEPPTAVQGNTTALANATSVAARRRLHREHRRRLDDESSQSEECFSISTEPSEDANATQANATAESEVARDGTTSYLASLGTSAERFFMNNLITMALAFLGLVLLHLLVLWLLKRYAATPSVPSALPAKR